MGMLMFKSFLRRKKVKQAENLASQNAYLSLYQAQQQHSYIDVQLDGEQQVYQSMMLSLDQQERTILIDELVPEVAIEEGQCVTVTVRQSQGRRLKFSSVVVDYHNNHGRQLCVLAMPQSLEEEQRRSSYRLPLNGEALESSFIGPDQASYRAKLRNLSVGGICLELDSDDAEQWLKGSTLKQVAFQFEGDEFESDLTVCNVRNDQARLERQLIGGEFLNMPMVSQRELEKSIMRIQRGRVRIGQDLD
jgi:c-di-GMP-binding flagellar brake protein YcgR